MPEKPRIFVRVLLRGLLALVLLAAITAGILWWYFHPATEPVVQVVYSQRNGVDLSYRKVSPSGNSNGAAVLLLVSGSWKSGPDKFDSWMAAPFIRRGYTVFAISHLSQPKALIGEIADDIGKAVRHIRYHAEKYGIDRNRFGVSGGSSGGHLSLMLATRGGMGPPESENPVDRESSEVQAVAVFFPVTDLLNLGDSTQNPGDGGPPISYVKGFGPGADDLSIWKGIGHELSPIFHISSSLPPVLIIHGDADRLVPLDQSTRFQEAASAAGKDVTVLVRHGKDHGWLTMLLDIRHFANWFDEHLLD